MAGSAAAFHTIIVEPSLPTRTEPVGRKRSGQIKVDQNAIRRALQAEIRRMLPRITWEEVEAALR